ncbi:aspartate ammonia-lyase [Acidihalobacter yilgarnensis]|uniref:Fumarate hydratase class II n=1 Tax=Acidihalobacter yilgarnensis TaxID=2819280 RepID=A0A1D8INT0_9GAMM|nr:class II fumarate hydratase [Acidihalobacter yilgarnensis]AOU98117.1 aspartate ammonia-lyase [Acidihalobacter yilgarnensis]
MASVEQYRIEHDSMGELRVPVEAPWGAQTQRAIENFPVSGQRMPARFIQAVAMIKSAAAHAHADLGLMPEDLALAIAEAADAVAEGAHADAFPVDVYQTGSGTSTNMNVNEVVAHLASARLGRAVHPNDDVNRGQSSNDVIPSAIHLSAALACHQQLLPALDGLASAIEARAGELGDAITTGRTHLMDAMPVRLSQILGGWAAQIRLGAERIVGALPQVYGLAQGGTAVGTGVNAHPELGRRIAARLAERTGVAFHVRGDLFEGLSAQDDIVALSGQMKSIATALMKIANDLRWMNSGPLAGLGEISLPSLQPGSSIMPGKVNPVVPEAVCMVAAQVIGLDAAITVGGQSGNFQLNVMLPLIANNILQSIELTSNVSSLLAERAILGFAVNRSRTEAALARNPILVTALNGVIGYERGAAIAKRAYAEGRPVLEVALEMTDLGEVELKRLLDPAGLTGST